MEKLNLTDEKCADLMKRGTNYLRVLGVAWDEIDECMGRAFVRLCGLLTKNPAGEHESIADGFWRKAVYQSVVDNFRQTRRMRVPTGTDVTEDIATEYEAGDFEHRVLHDVFELLTEDDIIVLLALVDNDLNVTNTAAYLGEQRTNLYHVIRRIRDKVAVKYPELRDKKSPGKSSARVQKFGDWSRVFSVVEECEYQEWGPALFDKAEESRVSGKIIARNRVTAGLQATTTPSIVSAAIVYDGPEIVLRGLSGDVTSAKFDRNQ